MSNILETNLMSKKERIKIFQYYINKTGQYIKDKINAVKQEFVVMLDTYIESESEDYNTDNDYGNGVKDSFSIDNIGSSDYISIDYIDMKDNNSVSNKILKRLDKNIEGISLKILVSSNSIKFSEELIKKIFNTYKNIEFNFSNSDNWITLSSNKVSILNLKILNANIILNGISDINAENVIIDNCVFKSSDLSLGSKLNITSKYEITVSNIFISNESYLNFIGNYNKDNRDNSVITLSNAKIVFSDLNNVNHNTSIISVAQFNEAIVSDIESSQDIPNYSLISFIGIKTCMISNVERKFFKAVANTYTINLVSIYEAKISNLSYISNNKNDSKVGFINIRDPFFSFKLSLMSFNIMGMKLLNLKGLEFDNLTIIDGFITNENFMDMQLSKINKIVLDNVNCDLDSFEIESNDIGIFESTINAKKNISIINRNNLSINDSKMNSNKISIINNYNKTVFNTSNSSYTSNELNFFTDKNTLSETNDTNIKIDNAKINGKINIYDIGNVTIDSDIINSDEIQIKDINSIEFIFKINYNFAPIKFNCINSYLYNCYYKMRNTSRNANLNFDNCKGFLQIYFDNTSDPKTKSNILLESSSLNVKCDSEVKRIVTVKSNNNKGSKILGDENTNISLDMGSKDISIFEYTEDKNINQTPEIVYYGKY